MASERAPEAATCPLPPLWGLKFMKISAYWSNDLGWVRLEKCEDGEYCHTSGYLTRDSAMGLETNSSIDSLWDENGLPSFLREK